MLLYAIGIYVNESPPTEKPNIKKIQSTQLDLIGNQLSNVDKALLESDEFSTMIPNRYYVSKLKDEYIYTYKSTEKDVVFAIVSRDEIDPRPNNKFFEKTFEKFYLFKNIGHVYLRQEKVCITLDKILREPNNYIGKEILIGRVQEKMAEVIVEMHKNIDLAIKRGESLDQLQQKAIHLDETAIKFEAKARKMNGCCW